MLYSRGVPEWLEDRYQQHKQTSRALYDALVDRVAHREAALLRTRDFFSEFGAEELGWIAQGFLTLRTQDREVRMFSDGDWLPLAPAWKDTFHLVGDFRTDLVVFDAEAARAAVLEDPEILAVWVQWNNEEKHLFGGLCAQFAPVDVPCDMVVKNFAPGEIIVSQSEPVQAVFEMISGSAAVEIDGLVVGEIGSGEIFGEQGVLSNGRTTAQVRATSGCFVRVIEPHAFLGMLESNAAFAAGLVRTLSARIGRLNRLLVEKGGGEKSA